jgi:hypothetical protein
MMYCGASSIAPKTKPEIFQRFTSAHPWPMVSIVRNTISMQGYFLSGLFVYFYYFVMDGVAVL